MMTSGSFVDAVRAHCEEDTDGLEAWLNQLVPLAEMTPEALARQWDLLSGRVASHGVLVATPDGWRLDV
jgi:hypothetical protein